MKIFDEKGLRDALEGLGKASPGQPGNRKLLGYRAHRFCLIGAVVVTVACFVLHLASLFVQAESLRLAVIPLSLLSFAAFATMLLSSGFGRRSREITLRGDLLGGIQSSVEEMSTVAKRTPMVAKIVVLLVGAYCCANFYMFVGISAGGSPVERDGRYWLEDHGRVVRALDDEEFRRRQMWEVRGLSTHLLAFALLSAVGFAYVVDHRPKDAS